METQFDIEKILDSNKIQSELDYERTLIADRKLRILAKENHRFKAIRIKLRDLIEDYESKHWSNKSKINEQKLRESDLAESIAEFERIFLENRKTLIKSRLKKLEISQQDLGEILGHRSKTYMSELINGVSPFVLKDIVIINRLLKIDLGDLVPTFLSQKIRAKIQYSLGKLDNPKLKLSSQDFELV